MIRQKILALAADIADTEPVGGAFFFLYDIGLAPYVSVSLIKDGQSSGTAQFDAKQITAGLKISIPFDAVIITSPIDATVSFFVGTQALDATLLSTSFTISNGADNAVPVSGPLTNTQLRATPVVVQEAQHSVASYGTAAIDVVAGIAVAADPTRGVLRIRNAGTGKVYLGGAGVTPATAWAVLFADDTFEDFDSASAAVYAVGDIAGSIAYQEFE